jgi:glycosyltransferase involved in cell wall biosynthesis
MVQALSIAHVDAESGFSGGEVQVFLLMEGLRRAGYRNVLLAPPGSRAEGEALRRGLETRSAVMRNDLDLRGVLRLRQQLAAAGVDLVHLHTSRATWLGGLAARWLGLPAITTRRQDRRVARSARTRLVYGRLVRRVVAISPSIGRGLVAGGVDPERLVTIPSAVDRAALEPARTAAEVRAELGVANGELLVLTLAALVERKGVDLLLQAQAALQGARGVLVVAGDGPERARLEGLARTLGVLESVRFLGRREDRADLLGACDVLALASRAEGLGVAALEGMACGRAVLAARVGGLAEAVVHEETGLLVPPDDVAALAAAWRRLRDEPGLRARLGAAGPRRVDQGFRAEQMVAAYVRLYREVLDEAALTAGGPR